MKTTLSITGAVLLSASALGQAPAVSDEALPVRQVTLFSSGVSYTERRGTVDGDAAVPLTFRISQINDILKSLVLIDTGGSVQPAVYATRDPIAHTLKSFAVDVTQNLNQQEIFANLKGSKVSVETPGKPTITGQILGVEQRQVASEDGKPMEAPFLSLITDTGIVAVRLDTDKSVRLLDAKLDKELRDALGLLATGTDDGRRQVSLKFSGHGKREVRVGYVAESSIWKVSYRLLIGGSDAEKAVGGKSYLQGWAIVENTTDEDWHDVHLSLVSGRPVSFIQDLYQPLYLPRPVVGPDVVASPFPQTHDDNLLREQAAATLLPAGVNPGDIIALPNDNSIILHIPAAKKPGANSAPAAAGFFAGALGGEFGIPAPANGQLAYSDALIRSSVASSASGEKAGEQFEYNITAPVSLSRQQAAMIPVITHDVETSRVSIFNAESGSRFPLSALRIHNTTGEQLKGGPITLFDGGVYAGDAKIEDIPIDGTRLLSYAVDLAVEGERQTPSSTVTETAINLNHGVLVIERKERTETTYTIRSRADKPRTVIVEHPFEANCTLVSPAKADERTGNLYRFNVPVAPGKSETLHVVTERPLLERFAILDGDSNTLVSYTNRKEISDQIRASLKEVIARRQEIQRLTAEAADRSGQVDTINTDQDRIRKNMAQLDRASTLYKRYVDELDKQETQMHTLLDEAARFKGEAQSRQEDLRKYVEALQSK